MSIILRDIDRCGFATHFTATEWSLHNTTTP